MSPSLGTRDVSYLIAGDLEMTLSYRYLHSANLFIGTEEQTEVREAGTEPRHTRHSFDLSARYAFSERFSTTLTVPFIHATTSFSPGGLRQSVSPGLALGDIRVQSGIWLLDPLTHPDGNVAVSFGLKIPTASHEEKVSLTLPSGPMTVPADIADQPGDGGWGVIFEGRWFQRAFGNVVAYASGFYMFSPRNTVDFEPLVSLFDPNNQFLTSVPDQYSARIGLTLPVWQERGLSLSVGGRVDGVPVTDVFGGSDGFRRPGYAIFFEPSLTWNLSNNIVDFSAPIAAKRNILTSRLDEQRGVGTAGGMANFVILVSYSRLF